jgi:hypothetical protein
MNWTVKWLDSFEYVRINFSGTFSLEDIMSVQSEVTARPFWRTGISFLIDNTRVDIGNINSFDIESLAKMMGRLNNEFGESKVAIVTGSDVQFGLARQFQIKAESQSTALIRAFRNEQTAIEWLKTPQVAT